MTAPNGASPQAPDALPLVALVPPGIQQLVLRAFFSGFNVLGIRVEGEAVIEPMNPETVLQAFLELARAGVICEVVPGPEGQEVVQPLSGKKRLTIRQAPPPPPRRIITLG